MNRYKKRQRELLNQPFPRKLLVEFGLIALLAVGFIVYQSLPEEQPENPDIIVYATPSCTCVLDWVHHLKEDGLSVAMYKRPLLSPLRTKLKVPDHFTACHTASVSRYFVEGHVQADTIKRLANEKPDIQGVALPETLTAKNGSKLKPPYPLVLTQFDSSGGYKSF